MFSKTKLAVGKRIYEDTTLSVSDKVVLLSEISECSSKKEIFEVLLDSAPHILREGPYATVAQIALPAAAAVGAYRGIRSLVDPCSKACGTFKIDTIERKKCMLNCKKRLLALKIEQIEDQDCSNQKNARKCEELKKVKVEQIKNKINEINRSLS